MKSIDRKKKLRAKIEALGFKMDRWGHYKFGVAGVVERRVKMQKTSWRLERYCVDRWIRISSAFYSNAEGEERLLLYLKQIKA